MSNTLSAAASLGLGKVGNVHARTLVMSLYYVIFNNLEFSGS
jgi:hypothetical protein